MWEGKGAAEDVRHASSHNKVLMRPVPCRFLGSRYKQRCMHSKGRQCFLKSHGELAGPHQAKETPATADGESQ